VILLVRHGRTAANARGLLLGRSDVELDDEGWRQAAALAETVRSSTGGVRQVVSSPLKRCRATAEEIAGALEVPVVVDDRWVELDYGELDGTPTRSVPAETWAAWTGDVGWSPPGGESLAALGQRVRAACEDLVPDLGPDGAGGTGGSGTGLGGDADADGDAVVVTHVSPIKAAVAWALGVGDDVAWRLHVAPASISRIGAAGRRRVLHSFNEVAHLPRRASPA
jgi:broad specificity phosphatase PhoE